MEFTAMTYAALKRILLKFHAVLLRNKNIFSHFKISAFQYHCTLKTSNHVYFS